jgi:hypothetical protein|tara:strand:- start:2175 stop:2399 length:225 start_codon:yes stop_codon:yes gene_type:complete
MKVVDGRSLWLQENIVNASAFATSISMEEAKRELSIKEKDMKNVSLAYMYLYNIIEDRGLLEGVESFFNEETIH